MIISNYIEKYKTEILDDKNIEKFIWKYLLNYRIFTLNYITIHYLKVEYGIHPQIARRMKEDYENYKNIRKELEGQFKLVLDKLESKKMVNKPKYTNKIYVVG